MYKFTRRFVLSLILKQPVDVDAMSIPVLHTKWLGPGEVKSKVT